MHPFIALFNNFVIWSQNFSGRGKGWEAKLWQLWKESFSDMKHVMRRLRSRLIEETLGQAMRVCHLWFFCCSVCNVSSIFFTCFFSHPFVFYIEGSKTLSKGELKMTVEHWKEQKHRKINE